MVNDEGCNVHYKLLTELEFLSFAMLTNSCYLLEIIINGYEKKISTIDKQNHQLTAMYMYIS